MYIYLRQNKFDIANVFQIWNFIFQRGPQQTYLLEYIYTFHQIHFDISNVFQIWNFIFQRKSQQTFLLKGIYTFDQKSLIYQIFFKFEISYFIFARMYIYVWYIKCVSNLKFCNSMRAPANVFARMYIYIRQIMFDIWNVFPIWKFIFQRGPQQTYLLECI